MDTAFLDHLDTNYCPSDDDVTKIQAIVNANTHAASSIDADIACLIKQRGAHLDSANRHAFLLSPVRRIPDDMLSTVFHEYLRTDAGAPLTRTHPAVVVSHVCQRWRQLATSTPSLWNGIRLYIPQISIAPLLRPGRMTPPPNDAVTDEAVVRWKAIVDRNLAIAQVWLDRSGEHPIDVTLGAVFPLRPSYQIDFPSATRRSLQFLCTLAHRWRSAQFDLSFGRERIGVIANVLEPLTLLQPHQVPRLDSLSLKTSEMTHGSESTQLPAVPVIPILRGAGLRTLHLPTVCQEWATLPINWSTLKELRFSYYQDAFPNRNATIKLLDSHAFLLLKECHSLVSCDLTLYNGGWGWNQPSSPHITGIASLPNLRSLTIRGPIPSANFFQALSLPSLHTLHLTGPIPISDQNRPSSPIPLDFVPPPIPSNPALDWIRTVGHQLHRVSLRIIDVDTNALQSLLEDLPLVSDLKLSDFDFERSDGERSIAGMELARLLTLQPLSLKTGLQTNTDGEPTLAICSRLRRLHLDVSRHPGAITEASVLEMIASRRLDPLGRQERGDIARLEDVMVEFPTFPTMNIREELERRSVDVTYFRFKASYPTPLPFTPHPRPVSIADPF